MRMRYSFSPRAAAFLIPICLLSCAARHKPAVQSSRGGEALKSTPLVRELVGGLDDAKLDSIAAKDPSAPDVYFAALHFPGLQLLVVSAKHPTPQLLDARLSKHEYRDIYVDLNRGSIAESKVFIEDTGADGLKVDHDEGQASDAYEAEGKRTIFDGDWRKQKLTEEEYMKAFSAADQRYYDILSVLLAQLRKPA
jgi:hypothetical protein